MTRKHHPLTLDGTTYRLRLTRSGQRALRQQFNAHPAEVILDAASDEEKMCALLSQALSWPESGNPITDGEAFYDLLVDGGLCGQEQFCALALDIAAVSGLLTPEEVQNTKAAVRKGLEEAFRQAGEAAQPRPTTQPGH